MTEKVKLPEGVTMKMVEQIQEFAEDWQQFGRWPVELQEAIRGVYTFYEGAAPFEYLDNCGEWSTAGSPSWDKAVAYRFQQKYVEALKQAESATEFVSYEIKKRGSCYSLFNNDGGHLCDVSSLEEKGVVGFQFHGQSEKHLWYSSERLFIDQTGILWEVAIREDIESGERKLAVPVRALFIKE